MSEPLAGERPPLGARSVRVACLSDTGLQREHNEDRFLLQELGREPGERDPETDVDLSRTLLLLAVCDGMGGAVAGEVAASLSVEALAGRARDGLDGVTEPEGLERWLVEGVLEANRLTWQRALDDPALEGMGCTLTAALLGPAGMVLAHVGDSRAYHLRGGRLSRVTADHTLVGRLVAMGRITEEAARRHEQRHLLLEAIGGERDPEIDRNLLVLEGGDRLLLCSDGLTDLVADGEIEAVLSGEGSPSQHCARLVQMANARGGVDNITVVVGHLS